MNHFHNGDVHLSRTMVRYIMDNTPDYKHYYSHGNPPNLLADMEDLEYLPNFYTQFPQNTDIIMDGDNIYLSAWVGSCHNRFNEGCTIQSIYNLFNYYSNTLLGKGMPPLKEVLPVIDFNKFKKGEKLVAHFGNREKRRAIFVSNGYALSGQASNFDMLPMVAAMSNVHENCDFYLTNRDGLPDIVANNIFYTEDILDTKNKPDLNENAYLSTFCDVIIGRSSGAFSFALNTINLCRNVTFYSVQSTAGFNGFNSIDGLQAKFVDIDDVNELIAKVGF